MDTKLFEAASTGDIGLLRRLLKENPFLLNDSSMLIQHENPLFVAVKAGQLDFVKEIVARSPELAKATNQDGIRPLDVASAYGRVEIVRALLNSLGGDICRLQGRDGRTALHYAVINGRVDVTKIVLDYCLDSIKDVTVFGETALHLAVKFFKFEVLRCLLNQLGEVGAKELINYADKQGDTLLHCAVARRQFEIIEFMLHWSAKNQNALDINAINAKGLTAIDVLDIRTESSGYDVELRKILSSAGGHGALEVHDAPPRGPIFPNKRAGNDQTLTEKPKKWTEWLEYFQFQWQRDKPGEARETLLVVAALFATVTFQAGVTPPDHLVEPDENSNPSGSNLYVLVMLTGFLVLNSISLSMSLAIIDYLTANLPFQRELRISGWSMMGAYGWSMGSTKPDSLSKIILLSLSLFTPMFFRFIPELTRLCWKRKQRNSTNHGSA